jgi:hypothetical protein
MTDLFESSVVVRALKRMAGTSLIVSAFAAIGRAFQRVDRAIEQAAADKESAVDAARVRAIVADSRLVQAIERLCEAPSLAWRHSRARTVFDPVAANVRALDPGQRVRLLGWMIVVATVTRAGLFVLFGNRPSLVALAVWGVIVAVGAIMMAAPAPIAVAWTEWRKRRGL